jgi:hypothetical protein
VGLRSGAVGWLWFPSTSRFLARVRVAMEKQKQDQKQNQEQQQDQNQNQEQQQGQQPIPPSPPFRSDTCFMQVSCLFRPLSSGFVWVSSGFTCVSLVITRWFREL